MTSDDDRVAALESTVTELEATVRGLTEELVDANERIRELEAKHGLHEPASGESASASPSASESAESASEPADDAADADADGVKGDDGESTTDEESELDDIIVA
ncbi:MAG: hypothetical protein ABEJ80_01000 [Halarchaeum sp.]